MLFDPADEEFAVAFNPLAPGSGRELDLRATDFIAVMKRNTSGWGDQMSSLPGNAVLAFLHSERGGTLPELRRFLVDPAFRTAFLKSVTHGEVLHYWEHEAALANRSAVGSNCTRLDELLRYESLLHLLGQRANRLDFADILDSGKIFLARLSKGQIDHAAQKLEGTAPGGEALAATVTMTREELDAIEQKLLGEIAERRAKAKAARGKPPGS